MFHIYNNGMTVNFNYGDCGPGRITATANSLFFYGDQFMTPAYTLYQMMKTEAADPLSMFWYKPQLKDSWPSNLPLDRSFDSLDGAWVSLRSSWSSVSGLFVAMKAGKSVGHGGREYFLNPVHSAGESYNEVQMTTWMLATSCWTLWERDGRSNSATRTIFHTVISQASLKIAIAGYTIGLALLGKTRYCTITQTKRKQSPLQSASRVVEQQTPIQQFH